MRRLIAALLLTFSLLAFNSCGYISLVDSSDRVEYYRKLGKRNLLGYILMKGIYGTEKGLAKEGFPVNENGHLEDIALDASIGEYLIRFDPDIKGSSEAGYQIMFRLYFLGDRNSFK